MVPSEFIPAPPEQAPSPLPRRDSADRDRVKRDIATADKIARTGSSEEKVRNSPPAGAWNDTSHD
jgi:hypothetical protein